MQAVAASTSGCTALAGCTHRPFFSYLFVQEWGVDLSQHQQPNPATRAYVDWVHSIAQDPKQARLLHLKCCLLF